MSSDYNSPCCLGELAGAQAGGWRPTSTSGHRCPHRTMDQAAPLASNYETDTRSKSLLRHLLAADPVELHDVSKLLFLS